jgi:uncharacterized membrane protein
MTGVSAALVGVMISVALIPPAATVGIGLAWGQPMVSFSSAVLVLVNVLSINLSALVVLWYSGYRPKHWFRRSDAKRATITRVGALVVAIAVLSVFLVGVTVDSFYRATTEEQIQDDTAAAIEEYDGSNGIQQLSVEVEYPSQVPFEDPERAVVTVGVPPGVEVTGLAEAISRRVQESTGTNPEIQVRYVTVEQG